MRDVLGFAALIGALVCGILGWTLFTDTGYLKLLGVLMLLAAFGLLLVALSALRDSKHPGLARAASWLFWILVGLMGLMSLSERFGGG